MIIDEDVPYAIFCEFVIIRTGYQLIV